MDFINIWPLNDYFLRHYLIFFFVIGDNFPILRGKTRRLFGVINQFSEATIHVDSARISTVFWNFLQESICGEAIF